MAETFLSGSKYPESNREAAAKLRELALPMPTVARLTGIPLNTLKAIGSKCGWRKDADHKAEAMRLQAYRLGGSGAVPITKGNRLHAGAAKFLRLNGDKIALLAPDDFKRVAKVIDGTEEHKPLILKELGLWEAESSGAELDANADYLQQEAMVGVVATGVSHSKPTSKDDPKKEARKHAEEAGRAALRVASQAPPPIKTWRDLEIAAKLAGVATSEGVKDQPLINIAMLADPHAFGTPVSQNGIGKPKGPELQAPETEGLTGPEHEACEATGDDEGEAAA